MNLLRSISDLASLPGPVALAIGVFDGVHLGHQEVIRNAMDYARTHSGTGVVLTFDPHPARVLRPELAPRLLCSTHHKKVILGNLGIEHTLICPFTAEMANQDAETFVHSLVEACQPLGFISVGYTWAFGRNRSGNIHQLMELGKALDFGVCGVPEVRSEGIVVSSTLIREAVRTADFSKASQMLGRAYTVIGDVVQGKQLGRQLGFPTANVALEHEELPPDGVYAVHALLPGRPPLPAVANLGIKPTLGGEERSLEVHVFDFAEDLYGQTMEVAFRKKLRDEKKFENLEALKGQIFQDASEARAFLVSFRID